MLAKLNATEIQDRITTTFASITDDLKKFPNDTREYSLDFIGEEIEPEHTSLIAKALVTLKWPDNLYVNLEECGIEDTGAIFLAEALMTGKCPQNLKIDLASNGITDKGFRAIVDAICSQQNLGALNIDFSSNDLTDESTTHLAEVLSGNRCPQTLTLTLYLNNINPPAKQKANQALKNLSPDHNIQLFFEDFGL